MRIKWPGNAGRRAVLAAGFALALPAAAEAGAWLQPEGAGQVIFNPSIMLARQRFDRRGRALPADGFVKGENTTLLEFGFRENLTLQLVARARNEAFLLNGEPQRVVTSMLGFGARMPIWRNDAFVLSPLTCAESTKERSLPALDRRFGPRHEADARLLLGYGFQIWGQDSFLEAQAGYRWRSGRFADEARLDLTWGVRPIPQLLILLQSFNGFGLTRVAGDGGRLRQHKLQASAVLQITERWAVQAGVFGSAAGRNALKERGVVLGVWRKF
jgi:protein XagA